MVSESIRALVVILVLAVVVFLFAKAPACAMATATANFERRRNFWIAITLTAFLAHNFWIYIGIAAILLLIAGSREQNKIAMFFFLLFAVPPIDSDIPAFGVFRYLFSINYLRLLAFLLLLPAFLYLRKQPTSDRLGRSLPDKLLLSYVGLTIVLTLSASSWTNTVRSALYALPDVFLPYYVASRSLKSLEQYRDALMAFVVAALVLSAIGVFEYVRHWLLYGSLSSALGVGWEYARYLERGDGVLRAQASGGHALVLGYIIAVALGFAPHMNKLVPNRIATGLGILLLVAGLLSPLSRGPWVGAAFMFLIFVVTSPSRGFLLTKLMLVGVVVIPTFLLMPQGEKFLQLLPFVHSGVDETASYRQRLLQVSIGVILQHPFFGTPYFLDLPEMAVMRQGQGIIDIVNTYLAVALRTGIVGLSLFAGFFLCVVALIFKTMRRINDKNGELYLLGQVLFSTLLGIMLMIFSTGSIVAIPVVYWAVAGLGVGFVQLVLPQIPANASHRSSGNIRPQSVRSTA